MAIPMLGALPALAGTMLTSCVAGAAFLCTSKAATAFCTSCNCVRATVRATAR